MEKPIQVNGYYKYAIQIGWWSPTKTLRIAVMAQDILSKSHKDALYLMNYLYSDFLKLDIPKLDLPYLCPIIAEVKEEEDETDILGNNVEHIDLLYPN